MAKLWLTDAEHNVEPNPAVAALFGIDRRQVVVADDLDTIVAEIGRYDALEELALCYHGFAGGITIDGEGYGLGDEKLAKAFAKTKTKISRIHFEGCWVGESPDQMAAFARLFSSSSASGFTWAAWTSTFDINIPRGMTPESLKSVTGPYEKWYIPNTVNPGQINSLSRTGGLLKAGLMWYQTTLDRRPPYENDNYRKLGAVSYRARKEAVARTVAAKDAKASTAPVSPFEYVTVQL